MGTPKHLLTLQGRTFLDWCVSSLSRVGNEVVVSVGTDQKTPPVGAAIRVVTDERPSAGPLGGLAAAFKCIDADSVAVVSCDAPLVQDDLLAFLFQSLGNADAVVAHVEGRTQYFPGVYRRTLGAVAERLLNTGAHSMAALLNEAEVREVQEADIRSLDARLASFRNINTPNEYDALIDEMKDP